MPEGEIQNPSETADAAVVPAPRRAGRRRRLRLVLLVAGPSAVLLAGLVLWLGGGRYVSTDNAYVRAGKLSITTDVPGIVQEIMVREGERVRIGQLLFRLDPEPYHIALEEARARLASSRLQIEAMRETWRKAVADVGAAEQQAALDQSEFDRQQTLYRDKVAAQAAYDRARFTLQADRQRLAALRQAANVALAGLGGDPDIPPERHPDWLTAKALVDKAARDLARTEVRATVDGIVTNVDSLQPGAYLAAGQAAFSLVADEDVWVEASPKETDLTWVRPGAPATVTIDTYPGRAWTGRVESISPATGAEFSLLPPQNVTGNWVKVVQRIPVRIRLDRREGDPPLRAGMSAYVVIDTGRGRDLMSLARAALAGAAAP